MDMLGAVFLGWISWISSASDRRAWLKCGSCGRKFRPRTSLGVLWLAWLLILIGGAVGVFYLTAVFEEAYSDSVGADVVRDTAALMQEHPAASGYVALWIGGFTLFTLVVVSIRIRSASRRVAKTPLPRATGTIEKFDAPSAGNF